MGLFDRIRDAVDGDDGKPEWASVSEPGGRDDDGGTGGRTEPALDTRANVIATYYEVTDEQAERIADVLEARLSGPGGYSLDNVIEEVATEAGLAERAAERIVNTEIASLENLETVQKFADRPVANDAVFRWTGPSLEECHAICRAVREELDARGGTAALDEIEALLRRTAREYQEQGGTPERMAHWVPHEECRCRITRHVEL